MYPRDLLSSAVHAKILCTFLVFSTRFTCDSPLVLLPHFHDNRAIWWTVHILKLPVTQNRPEFSVKCGAILGLSAHILEHAASIFREENCS